MWRDCGREAERQWNVPFISQTGLMAEGCDAAMIFRLIGIEETGELSEPAPNLPPDILDICHATAAHYAHIGYEPPWIGYVALEGERAVGSGALIAHRAERRVELAYFTLAALEGRGYATRTAIELIRVARAADPEAALFAKTAPEENASTKILRRLGFEHAGIVRDDDIGEAWAWSLPR